LTFIHPSSKKLNIGEVPALTWMQELGNKIRQARDNKGMSQSDLAGRAEVSRATIVHYENGQVSKPLLEVITKIALILEANFEIQGCMVGNERIVPILPPEQQFCLPFDQEHTFSNAVVKIRPGRETLIISAQIRA
jgi:transcriptional regulator with XRE-family HTH domain